MKLVFALLGAWLAISYGGACMSRQNDVRALYGFSTGINPFKGKSPGQIVTLLKKWNVNAVFGGYDDHALVQALHKAGIKVYAEVGIFVGEKYWHKFPQSRPINAQGKPIEKDKWYAGVSPTIEEVYKERIAAIGEMMETHAVDGIWLDFIRWPCHWEVYNPKLEDTSFDPVSLSKFEADTGLTIPSGLSSPAEKADWILSNHLEEWKSWRCKVITDFVAEAAKVIKSHGNDKIVGMFGVPWTTSDYDDAIRRIIGQDYGELARYIDVFSPMVYHRLCNRPVSWIADVTAWVYSKTGKPVWPIVQAMSDPDKLSNEEFIESLEVARKAKGSQGVIVFTISEVMREGRLEDMKKAFKKEK